MRAIDVFNGYRERKPRAQRKNYSHYAVAHSVHTDDDLFIVYSYGSHHPLAMWQTIGLSTTNGFRAGWTLNTQRASTTTTKHLTVMKNVLASHDVDYAESRTTAEMQRAIADAVLGGPFGPAISKAAPGRRALLPQTDYCGDKNLSMGGATGQPHIIPNLPANDPRQCLFA